MCPSCSQDNPDLAAKCAGCAEPLRGLLGSHTLLHNRYRVTRVLGCGAMGAVYLAEDNHVSGRKVAIKENLDPAAQAQFQAEVSVMISLSHPGLPAVSNQFVGAAGRQYLVMDFIGGDNLEELVTHRGPLPEAEVIALVSQLLDILEYLHSKGVIHRDIKPANIKLPPGKRPVLVDFGIAKWQTSGGTTQTWAHGAGSPTPSSKTQTWARGVGTPGYAPQEQYTGGTDQRSDLYALGAVMYYLLTGQVPPEAPRLLAGAPLTPPRQLRPDLTLDMQRVIFKAMAPAPDRRYQSAAEMRIALAALTPTVVVGPSPLPPPGPTPKPWRPSIFAVAGAALLVVVGLVMATGGRTPTLAATPTAVPWVTATRTSIVTVVPASGRATDTAEPRGTDTAPTPTPTLPSTPRATPMPTLTATSIPPASTFTPTRIPPTNTPTRIPPTNTPRPPPTSTPQPPKPIASNVSSFSGSQGANGWWYQVEQGRNSGNFADFPNFGGYGSPSRGCWQTPREGNVRVCETGEVHPGVTGRIAYRWRSSVSRNVQVVVHAHKMDTGGGDGVWIGIFRVPQGRPPEKIGEFSIAGAEYRDRPANTHSYDMGVSVGDAVMVMVDIGGSSTYDATRLYVDVY
jgi:serine/threonine-protein kinase